MMLLKRDNLVADHIHGNKDSFFVVGDLDRVDSDMSRGSGACLLVVDFALLDKNGDAILHRTTETQRAGNEITEVRDVRHEE